MPVQFRLRQGEDDGRDIVSGLEGELDVLGDQPIEAEGAVQRIAQSVLADDRIEDVGQGAGPAARGGKAAELVVQRQLYRPADPSSESLVH